MASLGPLTVVRWKKVDGVSLSDVMALEAPDDIAGAALFLSTPLSKHVTVRTLVVDGGVDCKFPYS